MRPKATTALLALIAALALSAAIASTAAAALPEFQKEGKALTEAVKFTAKGGKTFFETTDGSETKSVSSSFAGEIKGPASITGVTITFTDIEAGGYPCSNRSKEGDWELVTKELKGSLGYLDKTDKEVGELFEPVAQPFAECKFGAVKGPMNGSLLGEISPVNKATTRFTITYEQKDAKQKLTHFEGSEVLHSLEVTSPADEHVGVESEFVLTTSKAIELKA